MTTRIDPTRDDLEPFGTVLLDIEGTTTPIAFVFDTLFPFAAEHLGAYLREHWEEEAVQADVAQLVAQSVADVASGDEGAVKIPPQPGEARREAVVEYALWLIAQDRKVTALKSLQGKIWRDGYASGELKGELFDDVLASLEHWKRAGVGIYIYSSGSVEAQKLLFGHSQAGDLTPLIDGYFDTTTGHKREAASYEAIAAAIGGEQGEILFLTDVVAEADAASEAGMQAAIMDRPGNRPQPEHDHPVLADFTPLLPT